MKEIAFSSIVYTITQKHYYAETLHELILLRQAVCETVKLAKRGLLHNVDM